MSEFADKYRPKLSDAQFNICFCGGDEQPNKNEFYKHFEEGLYKSVCSGAVLFSSKDKFDG